MSDFWGFLRYTVVIPSASFGCIIWATSWENLFLQCVNNKGADQPAHSCSLISVFVVCCLGSKMIQVSISEISNLYLGSVAVQARSSYLVANPEDRFSCDVANFMVKPQCSNFRILTANFMVKPQCSNFRIRTAIPVSQWYILSVSKRREPASFSTGKLFRYHCFTILQCFF